MQRGEKDGEVKQRDGKGRERGGEVEKGRRGEVIVIILAATHVVRVLVYGHHGRTVGGIHCDSTGLVLKHALQTPRNLGGEITSING